MRGRKPTPTALRILRGNPSRRPLPTDEPTPAVLTALPPPDWIQGDAREEWLRLAPQLVRLGIVTETDTAAFTAYCEAWATWRIATRELRASGLMLTGKRGGNARVSPYVKIAHNALLQVRALLVEFGLTPSSRVRLRVPKPDAAPDKWAALK